MSLKKTAASGIFWTFAQLFGTQCISFVVSIIMARLLSPKEFGLIAMISVFVAIGNTLIMGGLTQSLIRTENPDQEDYSTVFYFNLIGSVIVYLLIFLATPLIAGFYRQPILTSIVRVYCLSFIINAFSEIQLTRLTRAMDFKTQMMISLPSLIVSGISGTFIAYKGFGIWSLIWMALIQAFLNALQLWWKTRWHPSIVFNVEKFKHHFRFGYKYALAVLLNSVFSNIYLIVIGKFFVAAEVGYYSRADSLQQLPVNNISAALSKVTYPLFASIQKDDIRLKRVYKQIMQMVIFIIAPVLIIMAVLAEPLFRFLFTQKWLPAVPYFQILCLCGILYPIHSYNLSILSIKGRSDLVLKLEIIKRCMVVITIAITMKYGIIALAWGQVFYSIGAFFINTHYSGKFLRYNFIEQTKDILPLIILSGVAGLFVEVLDIWLKNNSFIDIYRLAIGSLAGGIIYIGIATLLNLEMLQELKSLFFKIVIVKKIFSFR